MASRIAPARRAPNAARGAVVVIGVVTACAVAAMIALDITVHRSPDLAPLSPGWVTAWMGIAYCIVGGISAWTSGWRLIPAALLVSGAVGVLLATAISLVNYAILFEVNAWWVQPAYLISTRLAGALPLVIELAILVFPDGRVATGWLRWVSGAAALLCIYPVMLRLAMPWPEFFAAYGSPDERVEGFAGHWGVPLSGKVWQVLVAGAQPAFFLGVLLAVGVLAGRFAHTSAALQESNSVREQLVTARDDARRQLRSDLHDGLGPVLAGVQLRIEAARNLTQSNGEQADQLLSGAAEQLRHAVDEIRRITHEAPPEDLSKHGLEGALDRLCSEFEIGGTYRVTRDFAGYGRLDPVVEVAAYRVAGEALHNARRHAGATHIHLRLGHSSEGCDLEVTDDGSGFSPTVPLTSSGIGLRSMRERVAAAGGALTIVSEPGAGTRVHAKFPQSTTRALGYSPNESDR